MAGVREAVARARAEGGRVGFVPTMGALHAGHLSLVQRARGEHGASYLVASIFVNPLQFGPGEDYERYPRQRERDAELLAEAGTDLLFAPAASEMYPEGEPVVEVVPGDLGERLCGRFRPGHFRGVLTVVAKLFNVVEPDVAVFGRKDFQQGVLIGRMVRDLDWPIEVALAPIVREADGLALSSRNAYLSAAERERALSLSAGLFRARRAFRRGERTAQRLRGMVEETLGAAGVEPQYVELVDAQRLDPLERAAPGSVIAVAAYVGATRLIDNVVLDTEEAESGR